MIFLTVGTYSLQFNRLIQAVDTAVMKGQIEEKVFAQIGSYSVEPEHMKSARIIEKHEFDNYFQQASYIISHAGMGAISMALRYDKALLVMPRLKRFKEHVNDHQLATAQKFEEMGHILVAYEPDDVAQKLKELEDFMPNKREVQTEAVAQRIGLFLRNIIE